MKLIIQIPCLNETDTVHLVLSAIPAELPGVDAIEILVVDDGSTDGTAATALGLGVDHVVRHRRNRGLAAAFATGLETALELGADIIVNTDGDHQYPGHYIADLIEPITAGRADVVVGDRRPQQDQRNSWTKRLLYRIGRKVIGKMAGCDLPDPVSGFRAYSRDAARRTHIVTGYSYTIESLMQAVHRGMAIEFVPIETNSVARPSRLFRNMPQFVFRSAVTLLRVFFMYHPLHVLVGLSTLIAAVGILPVIRFLVLYVLGSGSGHLQSLVLGVALLVISALVLVAGLLADLMAHNRRLLEQSLESTDDDRRTTEFDVGKLSMRKQAGI